MATTINTFGVQKMPTDPKTTDLCDCELSHNGFGMAGRECDCPAGRKQSINSTAVLLRLVSTGGGSQPNSKIKDLCSDGAYEIERLQRYERLYEALARAECRRLGIDPDDSVADGGYLAWHLVGYEAAVKEMPDVG